MALQLAIERQKNRHSKQYFSISEKLAIIKYTETHSHHATANKFEIDRSQIRRWKKQAQKMKTHIHPSRMTLHSGKPPKYEAVEGKVLRWIAEKRLEGNAISVMMVANYASSIEPDMFDKSFKKKTKWVYRFLNRSELSIRRSTHLGQKLPADMEIRRERFLKESIDLRKSYTYPEYLIGNIDQTPLNFDNPGSTTIESKGKRSVIIRTNGKEKERITVNLCCMADGTKLPPLIIYKGTTTGWIAKELEKATENGYPEGVYYRANPKAYMNEGIRIIFSLLDYPINIV